MNTAISTYYDRQMSDLELINFEANMALSERLREEQRLILKGKIKDNITQKKINSHQNFEIEFAQMKKKASGQKTIKLHSKLSDSKQNMNSSIASNPYNIEAKKDNNNSSMINNNSQLPTEMINNMSGTGNISNMNQSGNLIIAPNYNSSVSNNNNSSAQNENKKVAEHS